MPAARREFLAGVKALLPILLGVVPFGLVAGIAVVHVNIPPLQGMIMSLLIFCGAGMIVALQLIGTGAPVLIVIFSALVVNLRFMIYSASLAPFFKRFSLGWKSLLAYLLSDQAYAASILHLEQQAGQPELARWHYLGAAVVMWTAWQTSVGVGILLGARLPEGWGLDFAVPLTFLALAVPAIKDRPALGAALAAGLAAVLAGGLPFKLNIALAALVGIAVGMLLERGRSWKSG